MNYSLQAFKAGWGWLHLNFCRLMVATIVVPAIIMGAWGMLAPGTCPLPLAVVLGTTLGLSLTVGLWLSVCIYIGAKRKSERQKISLASDALQIRMVPQEGWAFSFVGSVIDQRFYVVKRVNRYWEGRRYFYIEGEIQAQRIYNGNAREPEMIGKLQVPRSSMVRRYCGTISTEQRRYCLLAIKDVKDVIYVEILQKRI